MELNQIFAERYKIQDLLGAGAIGRVFLAKDLILNCDVALKLIYPNNQEIDIQRFQQEVLLARKVSSKYIVKNFECGIHKNILYLANEYVKGKSLKDYIVTSDDLSAREKVEIFRCIVEGLKALHDENIIHRDLKLANIMFDPDERIPKIGDLGIAKGADNKITKIGDFIGSPTHIAPEIWRGEEATIKSDIYSLGITAYEFFAKDLPFATTDLFALVHSHLHEKPRRLSDLTSEFIPQEFDLLIDDCMLKEPSLRPSCGQILLRLHNIQFTTNELLFDEVTKYKKQTKMVKNYVFTSNGITSSATPFKKYDVSPMFIVKNFAILTLCFIILIGAEFILPKIFLLLEELKLEQILPIFSVIWALLATLLITTIALKKIHRKIWLTLCGTLLLFSAKPLFEISATEIYAPTIEVYKSVIQKTSETFFYRFFVNLCPFYNETLNYLFGVFVMAFTIFSKLFAKISYKILIYFVSLIGLFTFLSAVVTSMWPVPAYLLGMATVVFTIGIARSLVFVD
ncbi:MAG: serine/threonine protein kinase [Deltaproteobacteria bacterium]|nr:serine/threonine protein kinase [Deltaproteobacteria bacterium]